MVTISDLISDEELVSLTLAEQDNFSHIINRYKSKLFNYLRRITDVYDEDIEDLLQEIFLKIYLNLNEFDRGMKFSSWAYSIARNHTISNFRKFKSRPEGHKTALEDAASSLASDLDMEKQIDRIILKERIDKALPKLKVKYREVLSLKFMEEKSYQEISDIIKKPIGTVGSMINKAKAELKKVLISSDKI